MKNSTTSKKNTPSTKKGTATPQKEGISFSWVAKNIFAVVIVLFKKTWRLYVITPVRRQTTALK